MSLAAEPLAHVYLGHVFHVAGSPTLAEAPAHLVSLPQGALVTAADGTIAWVGRAADLPAGFSSLAVTDTLGGFIYSQLGKVPAVGDTVEFENARVEVLSVAGRRIKQVRAVCIK